MPSGMCNPIKDKSGSLLRRSWRLKNSKKMDAMD